MLLYDHFGNYENAISADFNKKTLWKHTWYEQKKNEISFLSTNHNIFMKPTKLVPRQQAKKLQ